jgi:tetratricopeptide (TPR) repeat protein
VGLAPAWAFTHYVRGVVLVDLQKMAQADAALDEAISLDPHLAEAFALKGAVRLARGEWAAAQEQAELALALEPEDESALNVRAQALIKQGKVDEARATMASGLQMHPDASRTHLNQGWILLESGDHNGAMEHFAEALRLEPTLDAARGGYITALKAKHWFYRLFLGFQFRLSRLSSQGQWMVLIGLWLLSRFVRMAEQEHPEARPFLEPIRMLYIAFVLLTWTADPLLELVLRFSPRGKLLLSPHQRLGAELFGGLLATLVVLGVAAAVTANDALTTAAVVAGFLTLGTGALFQRTEATDRRKLGWVLGVMALGGLVALAGSVLHAGFGGLGFAVMGLGMVVFFLMANGMAIRRPV